MSKRLIGIEIGANTLRVAILNRQKGQVTVGSLSARDYADPAELAGHLGELLAGEFSIGDQLVTSLPARSAYVRRLEFPFQDEKKIAAAISFELSAQLPVAIDDCASAMQKAQPAGQGASVTAAAVPTATLQALLGLFEAANVPVHRVDLAPFCHVAGLGEQVGDGLLICATDQETTVSLLRDGRLEEYRVLPASTEQTAAPGHQALLREIKILGRAAGREDLTISLMGAAATTELAAALQAAGCQVEMLSLELGGQMIDAAFLPVAALALQARASRSERSFNFRRGPYALKGEWANLKGKLVLLAALLGMTVLILCGSMTFNYLDKASRAEQLQTEMAAIYRSVFPQAGAIVDVPLQFQSALRDLRERNALLAGGQVSALAILKEISRLPERVTVELQEFAMSPEDLKVSGRTNSFEAVNQMARMLEESPMFTRVQVSDAKMSLDGSRIDFRLSMSYTGQRGTP